MACSYKNTKDLAIKNNIIDKYNNLVDDSGSTISKYNKFVAYIKDLAIKKFGKIPSNPMMLDGRKVVFNEKFFEWVDSQNAKKDIVASQSVDYTIKIVKALQSDKVRQPNKNFQGFLNDLEKQGVPKNQIELIKQSYKEGLTKDELINTMLANYSYTVEINTSKDKSPIQKGGYWDRNENYIQGYDELVKDFDDRSIDDESRNFWFTDNFNHYFNRDGEKYFKDGKEIRKSLWLAEKKSIDRHLKAEIEYLQKPTPSQIYSNLTVPGGTNYTENEISTPLITPSIKGHAQFSTSNGIGWFRSDESQQYQETDIQSIIDNLQKSGQLEINCK